MAIKISFSMVFLAMMLAIVFVAVPTTATADLCAGADYKGLCQAALRGLRDPVLATEASIRALLVETKRGILKSSNLGLKGSSAEICAESYNDAVDNLLKSLDNVRSRDRGALNSNLAAAYSDFESCNDAYLEAGRVSPYARIGRHLERMASNSMAVSATLRW